MVATIILAIMAVLNFVFTVATKLYEIKKEKEKNQSKNSETKVLVINKVNITVNMTVNRDKDDNRSTS